jgi:hypothetical protein
MRTTSRFLRHGLAATALLFAALPASALTVFTLNVPSGLTYGTVSLQQVDSDTVNVHVVLADGYNFVDTGRHEVFGFNLNRPRLPDALVTITNPTEGYYLVPGSTQTGGFGFFEYGIACREQEKSRGVVTVTGCKGGQNSLVPNDEMSFDVDRIEITEDSFNDNGKGYFFTADIYGPTVGGGNATFPVGSNVAPIPEPETYALMLAGLGFVGFMSRRRKTV